jgi:hypothetical protein
MTRRYLVFAIAVILASSVSLQAQSDPCLRRTIAVNLFDHEKQFDSEISPDNFQASMPHEKITVLSVTASRPSRVVIVLDASGSMTSDKSDWNSYIDNAKELAKGLAAGTQVGLIVFSTEVDTTVPLTSDREIMARGLETVRSAVSSAGKRTEKAALWDAIGKAVELFGTVAVGDTLYVMSVGNDDASRLHPIDFEQYTNTLRIFAWSPHQMPLAAHDDRLWQLAHDSGGSVVDFMFIPLMGVYLEPGHASSASEALYRTGMQFRRIASYYRVELEFQPPLDKKTEWHLRASIREGSHTHFLGVAHPKQLLPCERPNAQAKGAA